MRQVACFAIVLALGCKVDKDGDSAKKKAQESTPGPALEAEAPPSAPTSVPWTPDNEAAQFFSRPAENWNQAELALASFALDVTVEDAVSAVSLDVQITNPTEVQSEAVINLPIPPGAAVTGATLWVGDKPMVGVMLGSAQAREIYEKIVSRRRDPLLVAWAGSEMLSISIFPLEAKQTRRFQVTWVEPTVADRQWVPSFYHEGKLVGSPERVTVNGTAAKRDGNWVRCPRTTPSVDGDFRLRLQQATTPTAVAVVMDTSAGSAPFRDETWKELESFVTAFEKRAKLSVFAADWVIHELGTEGNSVDLEAARSRLATLKSAGLFDQRQAIARAEEIAGPTGAVAVFSREMPANPTELDFAAPVYWVSSANWFSGRDVVNRSGGRAVKSGSELARIVRPMVRPTEPELEWLPLETATGDVVWMGYRKGAAISSEAPATPVEALFYKAMMRRAEIPLDKIVSPRTSILVLESEEAFERWGVKDVDGKLVRDRTNKQATIEQLLEAAEAEIPGQGGLGLGGGGSGWGTIGVGRYGTIGHGGGTGFGYGTGGMRVGDPSLRVPQVRIGNAEVRGDLDKNIIRRYIRRKLPQIKYCYERALQRTEGLKGTATAEFVITVEGNVVGAHVSMDHPDGAETATCIESVIKKLVFPKPKGGGIVQVKYPFRLEPPPASLWSKARNAQLEGKPGYETRIGKLFGYQGDPDPIDLAWWLAENRLRDHRTPLSGFQTVADLLRSKSATERDREDARRIMSEGLSLDIRPVIEVFEEWGLPDDAARANELWMSGIGRYQGFGAMEGTGRGL